MKRTLQLLRKLLEKKEKDKIIWIVLMMVISAILENLSVTLIVPVISIVLDSDQESGMSMSIVKDILHFMGFESAQGQTVFLMVVLMLLFIFKNSFMILLYYVQAKYSYTNMYKTQRKLVNIFLHRPYAFYLGINTSDVVRLISMDTVGAFAVLSNTMQLAAEVITGIAVGTAVLLVDPTMAIGIMGILVVIMAAVLGIVKPKLKVYGADHVKYDTAATKWLMQFVAGIKEIKIARTENYFEEQHAYNARNDKIVERKRTVISSIPRLLIETGSIVGVLLIFVIRIESGVKVVSMLPQITAFAVAAMRLLPCANRISSYVNDIVYNMPQLIKVVDNLESLQNYKEGDRQLDGEIGKMSFEEKVELKAIDFKYDGAEENILTDAGMRIPIGKSVGIIGTSGSGKTTAVDLMLGLLTPQKGEILVDDKSIEQNYQGWLANVAYIPQTIFLLDDSIRTNILFGADNTPENEQEVWRALREAQLEEFVRNLPEGLDTQIGERGVRLSGGQRQRIGIARALYSNPNLLVFDEATSALDNETEAALMDAINSLHGKKTMIIIAHRLQTIEKCDVVYRVEAGKITEVRNP